MDTPGRDKLSMSSSYHQSASTQPWLKETQGNRFKKKHIPQTTKTNHFNIGSINVQIAKCEVKLAEYTLHVKNNKNDICLFQETHKIGSGEIEFDDEILQGWKVI